MFQNYFIVDIVHEHMTTEFNVTAFIAVNPQLLENLENIIQNWL